MGIYDRDYARDDQARPPMALGQSMVLTIIVINAAVFLANLFFGGENDALMYILSADVYSLIRPWMWWQLLTSGFAHDPDDIRHILFNMVGLWFLGREVERVLGRWEFLCFYLTAIVVGSVIHLARLYFFYPEFITGPTGLVVASPWAIHLLGASGAVTATVMLFIFKFPRMKLLLFFAIPIPAWVAGALFVGMDLLGSMGKGLSGPNVAYDVHLAGAAFAFMYFYFKWNFGRMVPRRLADALRGMGRAMRPGPKLRVHAPDDERPVDDYSQQDEEADRILAKIDREGMESLTAKERRILEDYSRRMRQKHQ